MSKIVVALGGNALGDNVQEQLANAKLAAASIADLVAAGNEVVVAHGNGPQVGAIKIALDKGGFVVPMPECTAMSQGYIGFHLQQALGNELAARGVQKEVATVLTQVVVDKNDPAFANPTKPIGAYHDEATAKKLMEETGKTYVEDAGRGWRWVVPSPLPQGIREAATIKFLSDNGYLVIACGGGGMPVIAGEGGYSGIDAVIDKDFASAKMAELINADTLVILTAVDRVKINFNKPDEKSLDKLTVAEAQKYAEEGHFAKGSMLPKVEAAILFAKSGNGKKAIIGSLEQASAAISGQSGTIIMN
ncbi:MAG: carbamate kinase [Defluviitaleaceae bacterium]|nr:carbamate kinase [Defluviitaleaceae bacterium]